ncbi:Hypothetical_protein [Hexamita inflata]|uniref:Hypothetical_protein n=1 Tax=Hexamita inflata TaxID=28002 RepID=A0AA86ULV8_9EUKA|nr:Hypothetical protein HINF_LOCUS31953 [Hexamita inflata]
MTSHIQIKTANKTSLVIYPLFPYMKSIIFLPYFESTVHFLVQQSQSPHKQYKFESIFVSPVQTQQNGCQYQNVRNRINQLWTDELPHKITHQVHHVENELNIHQAQAKPGGT